MTANNISNCKMQIANLFAILNLLFAMVFAVTGCNKSPFERTKDASNGGATGTFGAAPAYVIFNNELVSGGGAFLYPGDEGQSLSFNDRSNPISQRSIRYSWTGEAVTNTSCQAQNPTHAFAGFDLMDTATRAEYDAQTVGHDLRQAGYTKVTFYARGSLSTNTYLKVEVASPKATNACTGTVSPCLKLVMANTSDPDPLRDPTCSVQTLSESWGQYTIPIQNSDLQSVQDLFKATFVFVDPFVGNLAPGQGGTAYFDVIQYKP